MCCLSLCVVFVFSLCVFVFFFNDTATTEIYPLSLHDALPICRCGGGGVGRPGGRLGTAHGRLYPDRNSTRLNSSHTIISHAVFSLKKKNHLLGCHPRRRIHLPPSRIPRHTRT